MGVHASKYRSISGIYSSVLLLRAIHDTNSTPPCLPEVLHSKYIYS
jgi:hypothetical protein